MSVLLAQADACKLPLPDRSVDLVFGSPPYCDARTYGIDAQRSCVQWVNWMLAVTTEAMRVCRGPVVWVAAGVTRQFNYQPACEGLMWKWWLQDDECHLYRPCVFHRVGIPGSGGKDWFRADWEYIMCFKRPGQLPWADNTACGHPPKWAPGGTMSYRHADGRRRNARTGSRLKNRNQWGHSGNGHAGARRQNGKRDKVWRPSHVTPSQTARQNGDDGNGSYVPPVKANPGNAVEQFYTADQVAEILRQYEAGDWVHALVGGNLMGSKLAHENEAPFPEVLAERFVRSLCPPGGRVLDPFSGSGTTAAVAERFGRLGIGFDLRLSQCELTGRRVAEARAKQMTA